MNDKVQSAWRAKTLLGIFSAVAVVLCWRSVDLQVINNATYQDKGDASHIRQVSIPARRGVIKDRNGEPLAISTPVDSVWANPRELLSARERIPDLARVLGVDARDMQQQLEMRADRGFVYLKRRVTPALAQRVMDLEVRGVALQRESRRYYPTAEVSSTLLGITNIDDRGQEGVELMFEGWLGGVDGSKRVQQDRMGRAVADLELVKAPREGRDLVLSIDRRIQYLAYRELKAAVQRHHARSGSMVILDATTGEILAMVNQPSFNPHARVSAKSRNESKPRNRVVTDVFEPGSTVKPFSVAAALESGLVRADAIIDTRPGWMSVGRSLVKDHRNYGVMSLTEMVARSSNVGVAKLALATDKNYLYGTYKGAGFGSGAALNFPGEQSGWVNDVRRWRPIDQAAVAYGYGVATTALQLARAYLVLAGDGVSRQVSLQRVSVPIEGQRVFKPQTIATVRRMMEAVVGSAEGTASRAKIPGYRVAGKTGTVQKREDGAYSDEKHLALFAGMVPASRPRLVGVVVVDEPRGKEYYGGEVAAPVFAAAMGGALRLLDIAPDDAEGAPVTVAAAPIAASSQRLVR